MSLLITLACILLGCLILPYAFGALMFLLALIVGAVGSLFALIAGAWGAFWEWVD